MTCLPGIRRSALASSEKSLRQKLSDRSHPGSAARADNSSDTLIRSSSQGEASFRTGTPF
jgi:hypothetical protein